MTQYAEYHDATLTEHQQNVAQFSSHGYRIISLSMYPARPLPTSGYASPLSTSQVPLFAAVWAQEDGPPWFVAYTHDVLGWELSYATNLAAGYVPKLIATQGVLFATVWEQLSQPPAPYLAGMVRAAVDLDATAFKAQNDLASKSRMILRSVAIYNTNADPWFAAVWDDNSMPIAWNCEFPLTVADLQTRLQVLTKAWVRPHLVVPYPMGATRLVVWYDDVLPYDDLLAGETSCYFDQTATDLGQLSWSTPHPPELSLGPICVQAYELPLHGSRFDAILASSHMGLSRVWRKERAVPKSPPGGLMPAGPPIDYFSQFDDYVQSLMKWYGIRAAQLAIVRSGKLAYCAAYTWAEPEYYYPSTTIFSPFRVASVSKTITGFAMMKAIQDKKVTLQDTMQYWLKMKTITNAPPVNMFDHFFDNVTIQHLLWHMGGFKTSAAVPPQVGQVSTDPLVLSKGTYDGIDWTEQTTQVLQAYAAANMSSKVGTNGHLPCTHANFMAYFAQQPDSVPTKPGVAFAYNNFEFSILGYILESVYGTTYANAVRNIFLNPLGLTNLTRLNIGTSVQENAAPNEVRYHALVPVAVASEMVGTGPSDRPLKPSQYAFNIDGGAPAGGWIIIAADYARIFAMLDTVEQGGTLVLKPSTLQTMYESPLNIDPVTNAPAYPNVCRGLFRYQGDIVVTDPETQQPKVKPVVAYQYNGGEVGVSSLVVHFTDGYSFVLFLNGEVAVGPDFKHPTATAGGLHAEEHGVQLYQIAYSLPAQAWEGPDLFPVFT